MKKNKILLLTLLGSILLTGCSVVNKANSSTSSESSSEPYEIMSEENSYLVGFSTKFFDDQSVHVDFKGESIVDSRVLFPESVDYLCALIPESIKVTSNETTSVVDGKSVPITQTKVMIGTISYLGDLSELVSQSSFDYYNPTKDGSLNLEANVYLPNFAENMEVILYSIYWNKEADTLFSSYLGRLYNNPNYGNGISINHEVMEGDYRKTCSIKINSIYQEDYVTSMQIKEYNSSDELIKTSDIDVSGEEINLKYTPDTECNYVIVEKNYDCYSTHTSYSTAKEYTKMDSIMVNKFEYTKKFTYFTKFNDKMEQRKLTISFPR